MNSSCIFALLYIQLVFSQAFLSVLITQANMNVLSVQCSTGHCASQKPAEGYFYEKNNH